MPEASFALKSMFLTLGLLLAGVFVAGVAVAWRRTGASPADARRAAQSAFACAALWLAATYAVADAGLLRFAGPPTMLLLIWGNFALVAVVALSRVGERMAAGLPLAALVGVHAFRLPLELMMHRAYTEGVMPVQMSYSGLNYDILTGMLAIVVTALLVAGRGGRRLVLAWNILGVLLLANIVVIAFLSTPLPIRVFMNEPANVWITQAPFVWLPVVMVFTAMLGHVVVFRRLRHDAAALAATAVPAPALVARTSDV